jgi:hypothetical protein
MAQSALSQIGVTEANAREWLAKVIENGGPSNMTAWDNSQVSAVLARFKTLPASAKGPLTTQLYAWAKSVVTTPAFKARYLKTRDAEKPEERVHGGTVDEEVKARLAKDEADHETSMKQMEQLGQYDLVVNCGSNGP